MANKAIYITVRLDIVNDTVDNITDEDVQDLVSELEYEFKSDGDYKIIDTEICGIND